MIVLVILLVVMNVGTLGILLRGHWRSSPAPDPPTEPGLRAALDATAPAVAAPAGTRRLISIEILNPVELAGTRGRVLGVAGSLAPGLTRRIVYDQVAKILRSQLGERQVVADVRVHTLRTAARMEPVQPVRPVQPAQPVARTEPPQPDSALAADPGGYVDEVETVVGEPGAQPPV
jgi:hypothetical protein